MPVYTIYILKKMEIWSDVTILGRANDEQGTIGLLSLWTMVGWGKQYQKCKGKITNLPEIRHSLHFCCLLNVEKKSKQKSNPQTDSTDCMTLKISVSNDFHSILRKQTLIFCLFWWKLQSSRHKGKGPDRPWWWQWRWKRWYCSWWEPWQWQWWRWDNGIDIGDDNIHLLEMMTMRNLKTEQLRGAGFDNAKKGTR